MPSSRRLPSTEIRICAPSKARVAGSRSAFVQTRTQSGTPPYQPPDADLTHWDASTDLFAVGVLLYQLLCDGNHPYPNAMPVLDGVVTDPRGFHSDLSPDLAEFLVKSCAPAGRDRFSTASEMRLALRGIRDRL